MKKYYIHFLDTHFLDIIYYEGSQMEEIQNLIIDNEVLIRLFFFFGIFFVMAILESIFTRRELLLSKNKRWLNNIILVFLNTIIIRVLFPTAAIAISIYAHNNGIGLFNILELTIVNTVILSIILMDLIIYWQHRLFHTINFFWKFHLVHHSDMDYDVTTGFRFHPVEIIFSMIIKFVFILILGVPVIAIICFEVLLSSFAIFNHSNIRIPKKIDAFLRLFIVTPDMHRVHHSVSHQELNSNYGFNISLWDKIFKSYIAKPKKGYTNMTIGLATLQDENKTVSIFNILKMPFNKFN